VENYKAIREFGAVASSCARGSKPCLIFSGDTFETDEVRTPRLRCAACAPAECARARCGTQTLRTAKSVLIDFFRGRVVPNINLRGLDRAIICTAVGQRILFRQCAIRYKKSGSKVRLSAVFRSCVIMVARGSHTPCWCAAAS
jgi:ribosome production factor 2